MQQYYTLDDNNDTKIDRLLIYYTNYSRGEVAFKTFIPMYVTLYKH